VLHPDGTPRTKHVTTNPIIEVDEDAGTASCPWGHHPASGRYPHPLAGDYYTVLQRTNEFPLQTIVTGRYHDRFECVEGQWRFSYRDLTLIDMVGDVSHHLTHPIAPTSIG
jgi:SnoaL-like domain